MKRNAALRLALSVILVFSVLLGFAVGASELAEYEIILNVPQTAAALEFFVVIPAAAEYVGFEPDMRPENPQSVHFAEKAESGGVWICVYADFNAYKGNSVVPGKVLVRMANPEQSLNITNVSAYSVIDFYTPNGAVVGAASATFVESRRVNTPPEPSASASPSASPKPSAADENSDEPPSPSPETEAPEEVQKVTFTDLDSVPWARDAIEFLATHRGILGLGDGLFGPNEPLTRAQFARFTAAALEITRSATATESTFSDVKPGDWFFEDVTALAELNILTGYPDGTFKPDETVTREQMAVILLRTLNSQGFPLTPVRPFTLVDDIADASDYAQNAIRSLYRAGLIEGVGGANYAPKSGSTRAQACVLLYRAILIVTNQPL